ncbi:MAG TPA: SGNH/GDSL hydrolase family protein [Streptosporangiaceae bacterium]|jgi:lysophospholipase L1-like esterase|nr:SGNH/GDSL hydrolase family protein [Streptosporangiaceae bacterium]
MVTVRWMMALFMVAVLAITTTPAEAAASRYVALGDSFTAGPLIPNQHGSPIGCLRSDRNYPSLLADRLNPDTFVDVSCSGADTTDMTSAQGVTLGTNPPQFDALTADTTLVSVGIGGNDIGYTGIFETCAKLSFSNPFGSPCKNRFGNQLDQRIADTTPKIAAVLRGIHERAPQARVLVVGYLRLLPSGSGCWPLVPIAAGDVPFLDGVERKLNAMLATQASQGGAEFVDAYQGGDGHDMCAAPSAKWVEGLVPTDLAAPIHPNARGMSVVADRAAATLGVAAAR